MQSQTTYNKFSKQKTQKFLIDLNRIPKFIKSLQNHLADRNENIAAAIKFRYGARRTLIGSTFYLVYRTRHSWGVEDESARFCICSSFCRSRCKLSPAASPTSPLTAPLRFRLLPARTLLCSPLMPLCPFCKTTCTLSAVITRLRDSLKLRFSNNLRLRVLA